MGQLQWLGGKRAAADLAVVCLSVYLQDCGAMWYLEVFPAAERQSWLLGKQQIGNYVCILFFKQYLPLPNKAEKFVLSKPNERLSLPNVRH